MSDVPPSHPRYASLLTREKVVEGVERGITGLNGLIAQGRGEALDYLLGEKTTPPAEEAERAAAAPLSSPNGRSSASTETPPPSSPRRWSFWRER